MSRWKLQTLDAVTTYYFEVAPNAMESPLPTKGLVLHQAGIDGKTRGFRHDTATPWRLSGVLLEQTQYIALRDWVAAYGRCYLYDHLDRKFLVRLTDFNPTRAPVHHHPWRHTYQITVTTYQGPL